MSKRLDRIHDNAERTAALPPGDMLLARLVLNGHLRTYKRKENAKWDLTSAPTGK